MRAVASIAVLGSLAVAGCASHDTLHGTRTVFHNPYSALEIDNGPVGPECDASVSRGHACYIDNLIYPGRGRYAFDREGNRVRLSRQQRRILRERFDLVQARIEQLEALDKEKAPPEMPSVPVEPPATAQPRPTASVPQVGKPRLP